MSFNYSHASACNQPLSGICKTARSGIWEVRSTTSNKDGKHTRRTKRVKGSYADALAALRQMQSEITK